MVSDKRVKKTKRAKHETNNVKKIKTNYLEMGKDRLMFNTRGHVYTIYVGPIVLSRDFSLRCV